MEINIFNYNTLSKYCVLSYGEITSSKITTIENGKFGSSPTPSFSINLTPESERDNHDAETALTELRSFFSELQTYAFGFPVVPISYVNTPITLYPNTYYYSPRNATFSDIQIILDAEGDSNAVFFIGIQNQLLFNNILSIELINGATNRNVYWYGLQIIFTGNSPATIPGIFFGYNSISFENTANILGNLYSGAGSISFLETSSVHAITPPPPPDPTPTPAPIPLPISDICFLGDTPITTDQGNILIKNIKPKIHTFNNTPVIAITKIITNDKYLICFDKDSLGENYPNKQTVMSKNHKIKYNGVMIEAFNFVNKFENVYKVEYNGEILYNILMKKYGLINVNNLTCETLHPKNFIARLYTDKTIKNKQNLITNMNKSILENDYNSYKKTMKYFL